MAISLESSPSNYGMGLNYPPPQEHGHPFKKLAAIVAIGGLATYAWIHLNDNDTPKPTPPDTCTNAGHELVDANKPSWNELAGQFSSDE